MPNVLERTSPPRPVNTLLSCSESRLFLLVLSQKDRRGGSVLKPQGRKPRFGDRSGDPEPNLGMDVLVLDSLHLD